MIEKVYMFYAVVLMGWLWYANSNGQTLISSFSGPSRHRTYYNHK
jgi:hypothetical protein